MAASMLPTDDEGGAATAPVTRPPRPTRLGVALRGDPAALRRVLVGLVDCVVRVSEVGEVVVHLQTTAGEAQQIHLIAQVTATGMNDAQAAKMLKPFVNATVTRHEGAGYPGRVELNRYIDFLGTPVTHNVVPGAGATFCFQLTFEADLSRVAIDLSGDGVAPVTLATSNGDGQVFLSPGVSPPLVSQATHRTLAGLCITPRPAVPTANSFMGLDPMNMFWWLKNTQMNDGMPYKTNMWSK